MLMGIPSGKAGILETLKIMTRLVRQGKKSLVVRQTALHLIAGLDQKDWVGEVRALHAFVRDGIRYVHDITDVETVHTPEAVLELGQGDCDDKCVLLASLLESIGHPTRYVAVGFETPDSFEHVYVETRIGDSWIGAETTEPVELGWKPPGAVARLINYN